MREACDQWDVSGIDCLVLAEQLIGLASALEAVPHRIGEEAREWELELRIASDDVHFGLYDRALAQVRAVVQRIRAWIDGLSVN
jgi:hypothetical protein